MAIESTGWLSAWRPFDRAFAVALLALTVTAACSGSSTGSDAAPKTSTRPRGSAPAAKTPHRPPGTRALPPRPRPRPRAQPEPGLGQQSGRPVVRVPPTVDSTGRDDVTREIASVIANAPNGSEIEFQKNARYRVERTLWIRNRRNITFEGNGATIFATQRGAFDRSQIWVKRGTNIVFRDLKVKGVHPNGGTSEGAYVRELETQHGFRFEGTDGGQLDHVTVTDVYGDFVYLGRELHRTHVPCRDIWIHDSTFARNGRQGIAVTDARNVIIERNHFTAMRRSTVDLEPNAHSWKVSKVFVLDNVVGPGRLLFIASHGQGSVDDVVISGNVLRGHALTIDALPPEGERRSNWVVTNNVSDTTVNSRPMRFFSIDGLVVKNNRQPVAGGDPGVVLTDDCGALVANNDFGRGGVQRIGRRCTAPLRVPAVPLIAGRGGPPATTPTTPTTQPHRPPTTRPHRPPTTRHRTGGPTTEPPASSPGGGNTTAGWLLLAAAVAILLVVAITWFARSRRGPPAGR